MDKLSLLIGSGFSVPASYPTVNELNKKLQNIDEAEICVHTSGEAWFLNGEPDINASWMGVKERLFVQEFLNFYNAHILKPGEVFHYERFYDYYISAYHSPSYPENLHKFISEFSHQNTNISNSHDLLGKFNEIFSQLLAKLLTRQLIRCHHSKPYHPSYNNFLLLLDELKKTYTIHVHSLNHDLYFEYLALSDTIQEHLSDGFEELNSPFYVRKNDQYSSYMVRLRRFVDKYDEPFCLYKLHGSIDNYMCFSKETNFVKIPWGFSSYEIHIEDKRNGKFEYVHCPGDVVPDFLSGTNYKKSQYQYGMYPAIHEHFKTNLKQSKTLIVIGYGFSDSGINQCLDEYFLNDPLKTMFIVDIEQPKTKYLELSNVQFVNGGVTNMNTELILNAMND